MEIALHAGATADLTSAGDWYESRQPGLGLELNDEVDLALDAIAENPRTWPRWPNAPDVLEIRRFLLPRFPFALAYMVQADRIVVLAVAHTSRRPGYWLDRLRRE